MQVFTSLLKFISTFLFRFFFFFFFEGSEQDFFLDCSFSMFVIGTQEGYAFLYVMLASWHIAQTVYYLLVF